MLGNGAVAVGEDLVRNDLVIPDEGFRIHDDADHLPDGVAEGVLQRVLGRQAGALGDDRGAALAFLLALLGLSPTGGPARQDPSEQQTQCDFPHGFSPLGTHVQRPSGTGLFAVISHLIDLMALTSSRLSWICRPIWSEGKYRWLS